MRKCINCGKTGSLQKHHIIHGHGKRRLCSTHESFADICFDCHKEVHSPTGRELDMKLKLGLQAAYFKMGYDDEKVQKLMGGKLFFVNGKLWGDRKEHHDFRQ